MLCYAVLGTLSLDSEDREGGMRLHARTHARTHSRLIEAVDCHVTGSFFHKRLFCMEVRIG
jgi:hypothetical protein